MSRADFHLLSDDEIRCALHEGAMRLAQRLLPRLKEEPSCPPIDMADLEAFCLKRLAEHHGVSELFSEQEAE